MWRKRPSWIVFDLHVHTCFSADSIIQTERLLWIARKRGLRGVAITDHNTIRGGITAIKQNRSNDLLVIAGSEIKTEYGDMIGLFLNEEIRSREALSVIDEVRAQDGLVVLPHPSRGAILPHRSVLKKPSFDKLFGRIDLLEVLSGRQSWRRNLEAMRLAARLRKPMMAGSDAHVYREVGDVLTAFDDVDSEQDLRLKLLKGQAELKEASFIFMGNLHLYVISGIYGRIRRTLKSQSF